MILSTRRNVYIRMVFAVIIFIAFSMFCTTSQANMEKNNGQHLLLILVPGFSFEHLPDWIDAFPVSMQKELQLAGISMRTGGGYQLDHNLLTLATGHRTTSIKDWNAYQANELIDGVPAHQLLFQRSGQIHEAAIVHPEIYALHKEWTYKLTGPGWLGEQLQENQIVKHAFGNSDLPNQQRRFAATFIMDRDGQAEGQIGSDILLEDITFPTGKRVDVASIQQNLIEIWQKNSSSFTVVEVGDMERLDHQKGQTNISYYELMYQDWFEEMGEWLRAIEREANVLKKRAEKLSVWLVSPMVSESAKRDGKLLAPFIVWQPDAEYGLLSSLTTKQEGIVANIDLLPSILHYYGLDQPLELVGKPFKTNEQGSSKLNITEEGLHLEAWQAHTAYLFTIYQERRIVITAYISLVIAIIIASALMYWFTNHQWSAKLVQVSMGMIMISPIYLLWITSLIQYVSTYTWIFLLFLLSLASSYFMYLFLSLIGSLIAISSLQIGAILFDLGQGSLWMKRSFLGFDPLIGARYYGLGNEYAGILLGSTILLVTSLYAWFVQRYKDSPLFTRYRKIYFILVGMVYLIIILFVAAPGLGTNAGATLAKAGTFISSYFLLFGIPFGIGAWIMLLLGGACISLFLIFLHMRGESTHIGSFLELIQSGQLGAIREILIRKWQMNIKLMKVSLWGKLFATSLIVLLLLLFNKKWERDKQVIKSIWFNGFKTIIVGAVLLLLINDSGIVAAATSMIFVTCPFISLRFEQRK